VGGRGPFPNHEGRHLIVALRRFVMADEAGTHDDSAYCVVAGYRGSPGQWNKFNKNWNAVLRRYHVAEFHSNVFFNRQRISDPAKNPYLKWTERKANDFLGALLAVFVGVKLDPVGVTVDNAVFNSYSYGERCVLVGYESKPSRRQHRKPAPYHLAFRLMLGDATDGVAPDTELHFIMALQLQYQQRAGEAFALTKQHDVTGIAQQLKSLAFQEPKDWPGLQAADLIAHQWYNTSARVYAGKRLNKENVAAMNALTRRRTAMKIVDAASIERMFAATGVTASNRAALRAVKEPA
jgi:hypothetical protein